MKKASSLLTAALLLSAMTVTTQAQEFYSVPRAATAPTLDAVVDAAEWDGALTLPIELGADFKWITGGDRTETESPASGSNIKLMWDEINLYCCATIHDLTVSSSNGQAGGPLNVGDGVQFCFYASLDDAPEDNLFWDFCPWTGTSRDPSTAEVYEHSVFQRTMHEIEIVSALGDDGYVMEWVMPWYIFDAALSMGYGKTYTGAAGNAFVMMAAVLDKDENGNQSLGYITDEWMNPATTDVYVFTDTPAGLVPASPEEDTPGAAAPGIPEGSDVGEGTAAATSDTGAGVSAVVALAAAAVVALRKRR